MEKRRDFILGQCKSNGEQDSGIGEISCYEKGQEKAIRINK